jgi:hypothetical protein
MVIFLKKYLSPRYHLLELPRLNKGKTDLTGQAGQAEDTGTTELLDRINMIFWIIYWFHHFPDENDERQSAYRRRGYFP